MKIISKTYFRDQYIKAIIDNFNWENVHKVMTFLDWHWISCNGVPSIEIMKENAIQYLKEAYDNCLNSKIKYGYSTGSGGFMAEAFYDEELQENVFLELRFNLESWFVDKDGMDLIIKDKYN